MAKAITASTQNHIPVDDIVDDIVVLKDGSAALILQTTAVNFGLLSEKEQDAIIFAYGALLNSLSHPIQILIRSKRTDISSYLEQLEQSFQKQTNPDLKSQIGKYIEFIKTTVQKGRVLDKRFYVAIPFSFLELGAAKAATGLTKRKGALPYSKEYIVEHARINLYPKKDQLLKQLSRVGLKGQVLSQPELVELFFDIYNPAAVGAQKITAEAQSYTGLIVEPAVAAPPQEQQQLQQQPQIPTEEPALQTLPLPQQANILKPETEKVPEQKPVINLEQTSQTPQTTPPISASQTEAPQKPQIPTQPQTTPTLQPQAGNSEKVLKELRNVIEKAKAGLAIQNQVKLDQSQELPQPPRPQESEQVPQKQTPNLEPKIEQPQQKQPEPGGGSGYGDNK